MTPFLSIKDSQIKELASIATRRYLTGRDIEGWKESVERARPNDGLSILGFKTVKSKAPQTVTGIKWEEDLLKSLRGCVRR